MKYFKFMVFCPAFIPSYHQREGTLLPNARFAYYVSCSLNVFLRLAGLIGLPISLTLCFGDGWKASGREFIMNRSTLYIPYEWVAAMLSAFVCIKIIFGAAT